MKTKVKAFTLHEMVVVMVISAIVMGLTFTVLSMVQKHMWSIQSNFNLGTEFNRFEQALWVDTNKYSSISFESRDNLLKFSSPLGDTRYDFRNKDFVVRENDTFRIKVGRKIFYLNGDKTPYGNVDAVAIELSKPYLTHRLFIYKQNDAKQFMD